MDIQYASKGARQGMERAAAQRQNGRVGRATLLSIFVCLSLLVSSLLLFGLTSRAQDTSQDTSNAQAQMPKNASGFLGDYYSKLQPDPKGADLLVYWESEDVLKNSSKFILDPVIVYLLPAAQARGIDPEQLEKLTEYFTNAIKTELTKSGQYEIVTEPGPGVMELRLAITNVEPNGGKTNAAVKGAAAAASVTVAPGVGLAVPRVSVGRVSIEGEMVDSVSGDVKVAFMSSRSGRRYFAGLKTYQKWGDIEAAFRAWAKNFRVRLDKAHQS